MIEQESRVQLRSRYLKATREYERLTDGFSCGEQLAEFINPRVRELRDEIDAVVAEVQARMGAPR